MFGRMTRRQYEEATRQPRGAVARRKKTPATNRPVRFWEIDGRLYGALTKSEAIALAKKDRAVATPAA